MTVVSDASSLGSFAVIDYLWLIESIYGSVVISEIAAQDLATARNARVQAALSLGWVTIQAPTPLAIAAAMQPGKPLDLGDTHALALALQLKANELLINERLGRQAAQALGLSVMGIFGVIMVAKHQKLIPSVRRLMDALVEQAGFRVSNQLYQTILKSADEI